MKDLALKLREARLRAGLSQFDLAARCGVGEKTISSFETGWRIDSIKVYQLERIVLACGMTLAEFIAWTPVPELRPEHHWPETRYA